MQHYTNDEDYVAKLEEKIEELEEQVKELKSKLAAKRSYLSYEWNKQDVLFLDMATSFCKEFLFPRYKLLGKNWSENRKNGKLSQQWSIVTLLYHLRG